MRYSEEGFARELHKALAAATAGGGGATVVINGNGVHWNCAARQADRSCTVHCFDVRGPQYLVHFDGPGSAGATGRTRLLVDVVDAVKLWVSGRPIRELYERFRFVDRDRQALTALAETATRRHPELGRVAPPELHREFSDHYRLTFQSGDRACSVSFCGENECPDVSLKWDGQTVAQLQSCDWAVVGDVLDRWLVEQAVASRLRDDLGESISVSPVARYYEEGRAVEGDFITSWDGIEQFYNSLDHPARPAILEFVQDLRDADYDHTLRAGQSLWMLVLSRSRRHGLRPNQPRVGFDFRPDGMQVDAWIGRHERLVVPQIRFTPGIDAVLKKLVEQPVD